MAKLKFDVAKVKETFKTRQELIGLGVACFLAVLCLVWGFSKFLSASSPDAAIRKDADDLKRKRETAPPATQDVVKDTKSEVSKWPPVKESEAALSMSQLYFLPKWAGDARRYRPRILPVDELQANFVRSGIFAYDANGSKLRVFTETGTVAGGANFDPLVRVVGKGLVIISGSFPYKLEVEQYQQALRLDRFGDVFAQGLAPAFAGLNVQRRKVEIKDGKEQPGEWEDVYMANPNTGEIKVRSKIEELLTTAVYAKNQAKLYSDVIYGASVTPLPLLTSTKSDYPLVELASIPKRDPETAKDAGGGLADAMPGKMNKGMAQPAPTNVGIMPKGGKGVAAGLGQPTGPKSKTAISVEAKELPDNLSNQIIGKINYFRPDGVILAEAIEAGAEVPKVNIQAAPDEGESAFAKKGQQKALLNDGGAPATKLVGKAPAQMPANASALIRFVDVVDESNTLYQYRVQVRMYNPNYKQSTRIIAHSGLALEKELTSDWSEPIAIAIPSDVLFSVTNHDEQKPFVNYVKSGKGIDRSAFTGGLIGDKKVPFEVHKFVSNVTTSGTLALDIGDWVVAERLLVARGDHIGRECEVEAVRWASDKGQWEVARGTIGKKSTTTPGIMVDFKTQTVLLDFVGGSQYYPKPRGKDEPPVHDESAYRLLLLMPDGTMTLRSGKEDINDTGWNDPLVPENEKGKTEALDRRRRFEDWKRRLEDQRKAERGGGFNPAGG